MYIFNVSADIAGIFNDDSEGGTKTLADVGETIR